MYRRPPHDPLPHHRMSRARMDRAPPRFYRMTSEKKCEYLSVHTDHNQTWVVKHLFPTPE